MTSGDDDRDGRNAVARGYVVSTRVTSIGMQMALPPLIGWWVDSKLNTEPWFLIIGGILGFTVSLLELIRLAKDSEDSKD
jgi:ATP synthase protein I